MKFAATLAIVLLTGCVGAQFNETEPLQTQIQDEYARSAELYDNATQDFAEKTYVFKNLKMKDPLRDHYQLMSKSMDSLRAVRNRLETEKNAFLLLTKGKKQISSKDKGWEQEQNTIKSFNADMLLFNQTLNDYSRESANFTSTVSENKMLAVANVTEIQSRMSDVVSKGKKSLKVLDADITAAKKLAKANGAPMDDASSQTIAAERNLFADRLKEVENLFATFKQKWGQKKQLLNTAPDWDEFQKVVTKSEIKAKDLHDIGARLPLELEAVKKSK